MSRPRSIVNVGSIVNPYKNLQEATTDFATILTQNIKENRKQGEIAAASAKIAKDEARADKKFNILKQQVDEKNKNKQFLQNYNPEELHGANGLANEQLLQAYSSKVGNDISTLNKKYGIDSNHSITSLEGFTKDPNAQVDPNSKFGQYTTELRKLTDNADRASRSSYLQPTKESAYQVVYNDILKHTGDPAVANTYAKNYTANLTSEKDLLKQEIDRTKRLNEARKAKMNSAFKMRKDLMDQLKIMQKFSSKKNNSTLHNTTMYDVQNFINKAMKDNWWLNYDRANASDIANNIVGTDLNGKKITPSEIKRAMKSSYSLGWFDPGWTFSNEKDLAKIILKQREHPLAAAKNANKLLKTLQDPKLAKEAFTYKIARPRTLQEILDDRANKAYESAFGKNDEEGTNQSITFNNTSKQNNSKGQQNPIFTGKAISSKPAVTVGQGSSKTKQKHALPVFDRKKLQKLTEQLSSMIKETEQQNKNEWGPLKGGLGKVLEYPTKPVQSDNPYPFNGIPIESNGDYPYQETQVNPNSDGNVEPIIQWQPRKTNKRNSPTLMDRLNIYRRSNK